MSKPRLYFAHPINVYNTPLEEELLKRIVAQFPDHEIVNPKEPEHEAGYKAKGMEYFFQDVLPSCQACVILAFRDGRIGKGVYSEAMSFIGCNLPVWEIQPAGTIANWVPNDPRCLTVEETRERIRNPDRSPKPY